jgi:hypothetical protein
VSWAWRPRHCVKGLQADGVGAPKTQSMQASSKDLSGIGTRVSNTAAQKQRGEKKSQWIPVFDPNLRVVNGTVECAIRYRKSL